MPRSSRFVTVVCAAAAAAFMLGTSAARASVLIGSGNDRHIAFFAGKHESTDLVVKWAADQIVFSDVASTIDDGPPLCTGIGTSTVTCPSPGSIQVNLY